MPKVSVLMASYNHERYVEEAAASVLAQSFKDFELIIVDDASRDSSAERLRALRDPRITLILHEENRGVCASINEAFAASKGEYIALIASDDRWHGKKLAYQTEHLDANPACAAVFSTVQMIDANGDNITMQDENPFPQRVSRWRVLRGLFQCKNFLNAPSEMLRRSVLAGDPAFYNPLYLQLQDMEQHIRVALRGDIHVLPFPFVEYRWHGGNLSTPTPEVCTRTSLELGLMTNALLAIDSPELFCEIFPNMRPEAVDARLIPYHLARKALESINVYQRFWGYSRIAAMLENAECAALLQERENFGFKDFYRLCENFFSKP